MNAEEVLFREVQRFGRMLWGILLVDIVVFAVILPWLVSAAGPSEWEAAAAVTIMLVIFAGITVLFKVCKLETEVRSDGVYVRFFPFHRTYRRFGFEAIGEYSARRYRPLVEYGGWGIRYGTGGRAYNVSGSRGVQLVLADGKRVLIGSQRPEEMVAAMDRAKKV